MAKKPLEFLWAPFKLPNGLFMYGKFRNTIPMVHADTWETIGQWRRRMEFLHG
jgi:predicted Zn-dependent peptidase